jgi:uncharacterized protein YbjT (DUF2867 family)
MGDEPRTIRRVCVIGASGKLGQYMVEHALARGYEVVGVCRSESTSKLDRFAGRIALHAGRTDDRDVLARALAGCDGVLCVLVPLGQGGYATKTAQAVLDLAEPEARLVFSCGWHITRDGKDVYTWAWRVKVALLVFVMHAFRIGRIEDQEEACRRVFASDRAWTVVRGSDLEEGPSEGLPLWSAHVGDPVLASNRTRRIDFALFMVAALGDPALVRQAPAIVGCRSRSGLAFAAGAVRAG